MNATMNRLSNLTVKALREIAAQMGVKLLSSDRKATIVGILFNHIESTHEIALQWDREIMNAKHATDGFDSAEIESSDDLRSRYTAFLIESGAFDVISEKPSANSEIVFHADQGTYVWAEPIDKDCKIGRINAHMFNVKGRGWFIGTATIEGRIPTEYVDAAHAEAIRENVNRTAIKPTPEAELKAFMAEVANTVMPLMVRAYQGVDSAKGSGLEADWEQVAKDIKRYMHNIEWMIQYRA